MKRTLSIVTAIAILATLCIVPASAKDSAAKTVPDLVYSLNTVQADMSSPVVSDESFLSEIPVFITTLSIDSPTQRAKVQESISQNLLASNTASLELSQKDSIQKLDQAGKQQLLSNPLLQNTLRRVKEMTASGVHLEYLNIYVKKDPSAETAALASSDPSDPAFWEDMCYPLETYNGLYQGYKFLYLESEVGVSTKWVTPGNVDASFNWKNFLGSSLESVATSKIDGKSKKASVALDVIRNIVGAIDQPLSITYGTASKDRLKTCIAGTLYIREVYIRDDLNRVDGYAYYSCATTEQLKISQKIDYSIPYRQRTDSSHDYIEATATGPQNEYSTDGFYGSATFYRAVIALYKNTHGFFTREESINTNSIVTSVLK